MQRKRSERVERTFAHVLETGGARRTWLRGLKEVRKHYSSIAPAHNLGVLMRCLFGMGTPRRLQQLEGDDGGDVDLLQAACLRVWIAIGIFYKRWTRPNTILNPPPPIDWVSAASV